MSEIENKKNYEVTLKAGSIDQPTDVQFVVRNAKDEKEAVEFLFYNLGATLTVVELPPDA